jgi:aquaporin NIP
MIKKCIAELIGTFILVFCCTGSGIINTESGGVVTHVGIAMTCGLAVLAVIYSLGDISGAHVNPAVTIAFAVSKRLKWDHVLPYVSSQLAGAFLASLVLRALFLENEFLGSTLPKNSDMQSFVLELIRNYRRDRYCSGGRTGSYVCRTNKRRIHEPGPVLSAGRCIRTY